MPTYSGTLKEMSKKNIHPSKMLDDITIHQTKFQSTVHLMIYHMNLNEVIKSLIDPIKTFIDISGI